jgi:hypothetical protein
MSWLRKSWKKSNFLLTTTMDGSSWFGSNLIPGLHPREISQLLEPYPQPIPNIPKVFEPLKVYKWRHSHGEQREKKSAKHCYFDCGSFEKGLDEEDLERLLQHHLKIVSFPLKFSLIYLAYFIQVGVYICLS